MPRYLVRNLAPAVFAAWLAICLGACGAAPPGAPPSTDRIVDRAWVELTDRGPEARLVTADASCPQAMIDGRQKPMDQRSGPTEAFPLTVCELLLPADAQSASVEGRLLPLPKAQPRRLLIFGDTGCRLKGSLVQDCNDPRAWSFPAVARWAASHHPDLVIHVGDYYYRETPCPGGHAGCSGSPFGDNWAAWDADFFGPATSLLAAAPWVMVRGNHEDCKRGGPGWFLLLDAAPRPLPCPSAAAPMAIDIGGLKLGVLDSSETDDAFAPRDLVAAFRAQFESVAAQAKGEPLWLVTHRPVWGLAPVIRVGSLGPVETPINATEEAALGGEDLSDVQMIVSGHIHHFASFSFEGDRPAQLVVGTGGDVGDPGDRSASFSDVVDLAGMKARRFGHARYGFLILDRSAGGWDGAFYDAQDHLIARCAIRGRELSCASAAG